MSNVDHPSHYNQGSIEVIDAIEDWDLDFNLGNCVKYVARAKFKGKELEDLQKARWYLERAIDRLARRDVRASGGMADAAGLKPAAEKA